MRFGIALHDHPPASRCPAVRPAAASPSRHDRPATRRRQAPANPGSASRQFSDALAALQGERMVWPQRATGGDRVRHRHLASPGRLVPIRYVLVRDVADEFKPQAFLCTDLDADPLDILRWFVRRWSIEVTFAEVRRHPGVETQRDGLLHSINAGEARSLGTVRSTRPADAAPLLKLVKEARRSTPAALISSATGIQPVQHPGAAYYLTIEGGIDAPPSVIFNERPFRDPSGRQGGFGACQSLPSRSAAHASRVAPEE